MVYGRRDELLNEICSARSRTLVPSSKPGGSLNNTRWPHLRLGWLTPQAYAAARWAAAGARHYLLRPLERECKNGRLCNRRMEANHYLCCAMSSL
jgi:hypothetical protein